MSVSPGLLEHERGAAPGHHDGPDHPQHQHLQGGQGQVQEAREINEQPQVHTIISFKAKKMLVIQQYTKHVNNHSLYRYL